MYLKSTRGIEFHEKDFCFELPRNPENERFRLITADLRVHVDMSIDDDVQAVVDGVFDSCERSCSSTWAGHISNIQYERDWVLKGFLL